MFLLVYSLNEKDFELFMLLPRKVGSRELCMAGAISAYQSFTKYVQWQFCVVHALAYWTSTKKRP